MDNFAAAGGAVGAVGSSVGGVSSGVSGVRSGGFDVAESSFESVSTKVVPEIGNVIDQPIEGEIVSMPEESGRIMEIPGSPHDKLEGLASMEDNESEIESTDLIDDEISQDQKVENPEDVDELEEDPPEKVDSKNEELLSLEQRVMLFQSEALQLIAKSMNEKVDKKEKDKLLGELKKMLKEIDGKDEKADSKKSGLISGIFTIILILLELGGNGFKKAEKEVKSASA